MSNPFSYGDPVSPHHLVGRQRELRRIVHRIVSGGQSTAVMGGPLSGKTSLLLYLAAPEKREELYGKAGEQLLMAYINGSSLSEECSQAQLWELALRPFEEQFVAPDSESPLAKAYQMCRENGFVFSTLEHLFSLHAIQERRLVLLLDEFDELLHHPILNCAEFQGGIRALAMRNPTLTLVVSSRRSLEMLKDVTQKFSRTGSSPFSFLAEVTLGPLPDKATEELLDRAGDRFSADDRSFLIESAGGQPYLLQVGASALWNAYEDGEQDPELRRQHAWENLYEEVAPMLGDTWRLWPPETRKAITVVALAYMESLGQNDRFLKKRSFDVERLVRDMRDFGRELRSLARQGFVVEDKAVPGGWRIRSQIHLWWLADELVLTVRDSTSFGDWLQAQEWGDWLKRSEREQLVRAAHVVGGLLRDGSATLIEAAAKGAGEALYK